MTARRRLTAVPERQQRVCLYIRVSALMGRGGDAFHSPDLQLDGMRRLAERRGLLEVEVVQDIDRTGRDFHREGIDRVLQLAGDGQIDVVALYDLARLGRNTGESLRVIRELRDLGVSIVSTTEQIDDSPEGQFMLGQFLGMAQLYSDQIGRRWTEVNTRRAQQGHFHGSRPPLGYQLVRGTGLVVDPLVGPLVLEAFERYARGHLISAIARELGERRGMPTAIETVKGMLRSRNYLGEVSYAGQQYPGRQEPLVDVALFERVQRRLRQDARTVTPSRHLAVSHSLVGLVVCDICGYHLQLHTDARTRAGGELARLRCRRPQVGGGVPCAGPGAPAIREVEAGVLRHLRRYIDGLRLEPGARAERQARRATATADAGRLRRELERTDQALGRLTVDRARRDITEQAYRLAAAELEAAAAALRRQLDALEVTVEAPPPRGVIAGGEALLRVWDDMDTGQRNRLLRTLVREVRIRRATGYREGYEGNRLIIAWL